MLTFVSEKISVLMVGEEFLAGEHSMVVDNFIEDAVSVLAQDLTLLERNELEVKLRFYVETQLVPGLLAVNALLLEVSSEALENDLPEWIERTSTVLPSEAAFLTEADRMVDPNSYALLSENLALPPDQCMGVKMFQAHLLSMAAMVGKAGTS